MGGSAHRKRPRSDVGAERKKPAKRGGEMTERMSHHIIQQVRCLFCLYSIIHNHDKHWKKSTLVSSLSYVALSGVRLLLVAL